MPPTRSSFTTLNLPPTFELPQCMEYFTMKANPNTDLWRKPPNGETTTAPIVFTTLHHPFVVAEVTVSADWALEWDQGGLVIFAGTAPPFSADPLRTPSKWVKAGMEFSSGRMNASSVSATADGADWSLSPLAQMVPSLRIKLERVGHALWIWYQVPSAAGLARSPGAVRSTWKKLREVTWFFYGVEDKCVHVGVYASRPTRLHWDGRGLSLPMESDGLVVEFEDLEIF